VALSHYSYCGIHSALLIVYYSVQDLVLQVWYTFVTAKSDKALFAHFGDIPYNVFNRRFSLIFKLETPYFACTVATNTLLVKSLELYNTLSHEFSMFRQVCLP